MKETGFNGYINDFSIDYNATPVTGILDIHNCLVKKNGIIVLKCLNLSREYFFQ